MTNGIYGYYDTKNQYVIYIGQDSHIDKEKRHKQHLNSSRYNKQKINQVLQNNSDRYIYFKFVEGNYTQDEIDDFEKEAIKLFKTYKYDHPKRNVFNFTPGGDFALARVPEIAQKISKANSGKKHSEETKRKMSQSHKGKKISQETRDKMSQSKKGKNHPNYGKTLSQETRDKIGQSRKGKKHSQETRAKISQSKKGKKHSQETKDKMSQSHKSKNTTGYYRVYMKKDDTCKQGYTWVYRYYEDNKRKTISSVDIKKLETKVKDKGLKWERIT